MDRCAVGEAARGAREELTRQPCHEAGQMIPQPLVTAFPNTHFPAIHRRGDHVIRGHLPVTIIREPAFVRRILISLTAVALLCGVTPLAQAQTAASKGAKDAAKPAATTKPASSKTNPPNRPRDPAYAFVSTRPAEKVVNEVSIMIGYQLKPGSESTLEVGGASYAMYTQGDGLWIKNAAEEERMVEAMRKSADVTVKGVSAKGTETTDTFSLKGLSQALDKLAHDCKR